MRYSASDKTEIIRLVEQSHLPARRTLEKLGIPRSSFYRWYDRYQRGGPEAYSRRIGPHGRDRVLEPYPRGYPQPDMLDLALDQPELKPAGTGEVANGRDRVFCLGGLGLSAALKAHDHHHQPGLHRHQSGRGVQGTRPRFPTQLWQIELHLSQDHEKGLVLSLHRAGRLLALHCRLEALCDREGEGRYRHPRSGVGGLRGSTTR